MCVLLNVGRLHWTHQDICGEKWQCQGSDSCVCLCVCVRVRARIDVPESDNSHIVVREGCRQKGGGGGREHGEENCSPLILAG